LKQALFQNAYRALGDLIAATPAMAKFAPWSDDAIYVERETLILPATQLILSDPVTQYPPALAFHTAIRAAAPHAHWRQSYTEGEVGADFLARYGWFELIGPTGHMHTNSARAYITYWGPDLVYPWHLHEAEELYFLVAGSAEFAADGLKTQTLAAGETRIHISNLPHAMNTYDQPILALVLWRGAGLAGVPRLGRT
jgi:hypothetical protein